MKICARCGSKLDDSAKFCRHCGRNAVADGSDAEEANSQVFSIIPQTAEEANAPKQQYAPRDVSARDEAPAAAAGEAGEAAAVKEGMGGLKLVLILLILIAMAAAALGAMRFIAYSDCAKPFKLIEEGFENNDIEKILEAFPKKYSNAVRELVGRNDFKNGIYKINDGLEQIKDSLEKQTELEGDIRLSYKILSADKLNDDQVKNIEKFNRAASFKLSITTAYSTDVRFTLKDDNGYEGNFTYNFTVAKADGDWVIVDVNSILSDYSEYNKLGDALYGLAVAIDNVLDRNGGYEDKDSD